MILSKIGLGNTRHKITSCLGSVKNMETWSVIGVIGAVAVAGAAILFNLPTSPFIKKPEKATLEYLADTKLVTFDSEPREFQEALGLSSLKPQLDARGVPLYAVVRETLGVAEFQPFFKGDIFLDSEHRFYGPVERKMGLSGFLRLSVWINIIQNRRSGVEGNMKGDGTVLGGVFVIGSGNQGILFEHREKEFGDYADTKEVMKAVEQIKTSNS